MPFIIDIMPAAVLMEGVCMEIFNFVDINLFTIVILAFILANVLRRDGLGFVQDRIYRWLVLSTMVITLFDAGAWAVNGQPGEAAMAANYLCNCLLFSLSPVPVALWYLYSDYQIFRSERRLRKILPWLGLILAANAGLSVASLFLGLYFSIDSDNLFVRADSVFYCLFLLGTLGFLVITTTKVALFRKQIEKNHYAAMLLFAVPPLLGGVAQVLIYGINILWSCTGLSVLFVFIFIQNQRLNTDPLTGAYNRRQLGTYIQSRIRQSGGDHLLAGLMLDLDGFKNINDTFGHAAGDQALVKTVSILRQCLRSGDRIFRFGGDEFIVIMEIPSIEALHSVVQRIRNGFSLHNAAPDHTYRLQPSIGYMLYDSTSDMDSDAFLKSLDSLMYADKVMKPVPPASHLQIR